MAWNGEGFDFGAGPDYWLIDVSGFMHGIGVDRLGGSSSTTDFKGQLFASTQRNYPSAPALWAFWDTYAINETELVGFWDAEPLLQLAVLSPQNRTNSTCESSYEHVVNGYPEACGGSHANIGFGDGCGPGATPAYPALTVTEALQLCCELGLECLGFSISHAQNAQGRSNGCFKKNIQVLCTSFFTCRFAC